MTGSADLPRMPHPAHFMPAVTIGTTGDGGISLGAQRPEKAFHKDSLLVLMTDPAIR